MPSEQTAELRNIHAMKALIDAFATNVKGGAKALKSWYKLLMEGFKTYLHEYDGDQIPGLAVIFHKSTDQLSGLTPKEMNLELTNKGNYSMWEVSDLTHCKTATLTRKWGPDGLWEGTTEFQIDVLDCEELSYLLPDEAEQLVTLMAGHHASLVNSKTPPPAEKVLTTRAEGKRVTALETQLREAAELQATRDLAYVRMAMDLHVATGGREDDFVSPIPGAPWSAEPSTSSSGARNSAGGSDVGSPKVRRRKSSGAKPAGGGGTGTPTVGNSLSLSVPTTPVHSDSEPSTTHTSPVDSPHDTADPIDAQAALINELVTKALVKLLSKGGGIPGYPLVASPSAPSFSPTITVNTGTNSELKKQNYKKVMAIKTTV